ncbi:MAG: restriction endonuclease subunit S, partial [Candidatus Competibacter sp.]|nr:restriction endonuclease subunit S [Candidatus Competibacter sp.]
AERAKHGEPLETGAQLLERILAERRRRWEEKQLAKFKEQGKTPPKDWRNKYPEPVKPNTAGLPELPEGWVWATVNQLALEMKYGSSAKTSSESGSIPVLRMGNIQDGELDIQNLKFLPTDHDEFPNLILEDGDLLFNRTNSPELVGKTAIYRSQITPCSYASYLIAARFSSSFLPEFASVYINSIYGRLWVKSVVTQQVGQANVNGSKLAALAIPLPPNQEQIEIARLLLEQRGSSFEQSKAIELGLRQSSAQRQNILKAAFSGQLVPQDPNDEPASVLLERIRAEREVRHASAKQHGGRGRAKRA